MIMVTRKSQFGLGVVQDGFNKRACDHSNESFWALHSILSFSKQRDLNFESVDEILSHNRASSIKYKKDHGTDIFFTVLKIFE